VFVVRFFPLAGFQEVSEWGVVHAHLLFERERDDGTVSKRETKRSILRAREYHLEMMIAFFQFIHKIRKQRTRSYYARLISTPALVSPSSLLMMMILMLMLMMPLLGLR
jgi:hypothetical protein